MPLLSFSQLTLELETQRARAEDVLVTARLATSLEARLQATLAERDTAQQRVEAAELHAAEAERSVSSLVEARWQEAGADRMRWPPSARGEMDRLEERLEAARGRATAAQAGIEQVRVCCGDGIDQSTFCPVAGMKGTSHGSGHFVQVRVDDQQRCLTLQSQLEAAQDRTGRLERELHQVTHALEAKNANLTAERDCSEALRMRRPRRIVLGVRSTTPRQALPAAPLPAPDDVAGAASTALRVLRPCRVRHQLACRREYRGSQRC